MTGSKLNEVEKIAKCKAFLEARGYKVAAAKMQPSLGLGAYIREKQLKTLLPFSSATLWRKVQSGEFPKPVKLGERITAWKVEEINAWLAAIG